MSEINGAEIFSSGFWNGLKFDNDDLDGIVSAFNALKLAGRVPLRYGHSARVPKGDDASGETGALGWVQRIYRKGSKLLADIKDIPATVYEQIKSGQFKFCSVELLRNVGTTGGRGILPWVLDALAILGTSAPAVADLKPLNANMARRALDFEESISFSKSEEDTDDMSDTTKEQFAALTKKYVSQLFEAAIKDGRALPRDREMFNRRFPEATAEDAEVFIRDTPRPPKLDRAVSLSTDHTTVTPGSGRADHRLLEAAQRLVLERRNAGDPLPGEPWQQLLAAAKLTFSKDSDLAAEWQSQPGER